MPVGSFSLPSRIAAPISSLAILDCLSLWSIRYKTNGRCCQKSFGLRRPSPETCHPDVPTHFAGALIRSAVKMTTGSRSAFLYQEWVFTPSAVVFPARNVSPNYHHWSPYRPLDER